MSAIRLAKGTRSLVTWGRHPAHGGAWLKLHAYSRPKNASRVREGWELVFCAKGEKPAQF